MTDPLDDAEIVKSKEYYARLLKDLDVITRPKEDKPFVLPESSVWNRLKLTTLRVKDIHNKHDSNFSLEREMARIQAATSCELRQTTSGKSPRKAQANASLFKVPMKEKEKIIEERLLAPYRNNPGRLADLIEHVKAVEDKNNTENAIYRKEQAVKHAERQERQESMKLTRGQSGRYSPSSFGMQDQFDTSGGFGVSEKHGGRFPASGKHGSSKSNAPAESAASRYMRQAGWLRIVAAASRMTLSIRALQAMRDTKAQDVAKWNAVICLQRFWRACFLRVVMKEAAAVGTGVDSMWTMSSKTSSRLRRITRSEKFNFSASIPEGEENELQRLLKGRQQVAQSRVREDACAQILTFLRDLEKLFRNRVMKFIRQVKILQSKVRVHIAVTRARTQLVSMWFERSLPALCLHVRIVLAGRGLDLRNMTANDRENIRQMELQYAEYRYVSQLPPQPDDEECGFGFEAPRPRAPVYTGPSTMALIKQMHTAPFHAFLRAHHEYIVSSGFLAHCVPASMASPLASPHVHAFGVPATPSHAKQGQVIAAFKTSAIRGLVLKNRRAYMKKSTKKAAVVFEKFVVTMEDARSFIRDGRDSLCEHLLDLGLKDAVSAGMRVRQLMGGKRLGFGAGATGGSGGGSSGTSRRASIKKTLSNNNMGAEPGPPRDSPSRKVAGKSEKLRGGSASSKTRARSGLAAAASTIPTALLLSRMPLPPVFLLLSSVTAQEMALLYFDVADKMRRLAPAVPDKVSRGGKGSLASAWIGRSVSAAQGENFQPSITLHSHSGEASHRYAHTPTSSSSGASHLHEGASHLFVQVTTPTHAHAHAHAPHHSRYPTSSAVGSSPMLRRLK